MKIIEKKSKQNEAFIFSNHFNFFIISFILN